jgi:large exoprotein involved in heme utilization and adhesion
MPSANFFLINPNGLVLGPNASFNVGGSLNLSTADYLRLTDGAKFFASLAKQSTLSSAPVTAFGFLSDNPAAITVEQNSVLTVATGETLSLIGGDISISGGPSGFLSAPDGRINIVSVASPGEAVINAQGTPPAFNVSSFGKLGKIELLISHTWMQVEPSLGATSSTTIN